MSETKKTLTEKLFDVQQNLKAPKGQYNEFGKYKYRSAEDILEAVKSVLPEGVVVTIADEIEYVGNRFYLKATVTISDGAEKISAVALAREAESAKGMSEPQLTGSASSYARKYALNGLFCIDDTKDDDTKDNTQSAKQSPAKKEVHQAVVKNNDTHAAAAPICCDQKMMIGKFGKSEGKWFCRKCQKVIDK